MFGIILEEDQKEEAKKKAAVTGVFPGSTHIKNGVILDFDAMAWLLGDKLFPVDDSLITDEEDEEEMEMGMGLLGILRLLLG